LPFAPFGLFVIVVILAPASGVGAPSIFGTTDHRIAGIADHRAFIERSAPKARLVIAEIDAGDGALHGVHQEDRTTHNLAIARNIIFVDRVAFSHVRTS
jgi:hypothetical protein